MKIGKRESQRLEKRAQIIAIARQHFFEHGYDNTTMSAIAAQLGGSKRTLWSYFSDKEELFTAMVMDTAAGIRSHLELPRRGDDPIGTLTQVCRSIMDRVLSPIVIAMFRLIGPIADRRPEISRIFLEHGPGETQRLIGEYLRENFADLLWSDDFKQMGIELVGFSGAEFHFQRMWGLSVAPTNRQRDAYARRAALLFLRSFGRDPDELAPRAVLEEAVREFQAASAGEPRVPAIAAEVSP